MAANCYWLNGFDDPDFSLFLITLSIPISIPFRHVHKACDLHTPKHDYHDLAFKWVQSYKRPGSNIHPCSQDPSCAVNRNRTVEANSLGPTSTSTVQWPTG